jgi:cell division septum initiation protein DivIVA
MTRIPTAAEHRLLDDTITENERLRGEVQRLEAEVYRSRTSERMARISSMAPCEQVTLSNWCRIDKITDRLPRTWQKNYQDFPTNVAHFGKRGILYDLAELRTWREKMLKEKEAKRIAEKARRKAHGILLDEIFPPFPD